MKILHITTNYPTKEFPIFGIFVKEQVESLQALGIDCEVFNCDGQNKGFKKYLTYIPKLWWRILTHKYDILHCHHALSAIILSMTGWPMFKKCVLSYQNDPDREWGKLFFHLFYPFFNAFIVKNNSIYLHYSKVRYLPNGCNDIFFHPMDKVLCRQKLGLQIDSICILYMDSNKGIRTQKRKDRYDDVLNLLRTKYGYNNIISIELTNTPRNVMPIYINACDLHLLSSDFEGSPNSVKECLCCNTPIVSTDVGNVNEMIGDINGCYVAASFTVEELAECADKALKNVDSFKGREDFLLKGYGMETVAKKLISLYEKMV
ncbi:MAG: glycosyltransferase family 4 protein [Endomicrobium sp.]|jgi:glycosyltransferase involved in cell wall biosynthesis|nr:glycosyltransferase family 4 protein [Endomicrobium sp.]